MTVGAGVKKIVIASVTETQVPLPVVVKVKVTLPLETSPAVGVYTALSAVAEGV